MTNDNKYLIVYGDWTYTKFYSIVYANIFLTDEQLDEYAKDTVKYNESEFDKVLDTLNLVDKNIETLNKVLTSKFNGEVGPGNYEVGRDSNSCAVDISAGGYEYVYNISCKKVIPANSIVRSLR